MKFATGNKFSASVCLFFLSTLPSVASADALEDIPGIPSKPLDEVLNDITDWLIDFAILLAILLVVWGGVNYVAALGDEQRIVKSKKTIHYALWGLVIVAFSYAILEVINDTLN